MEISWSREIQIGIGGREDDAQRWWWGWWGWLWMMDWRRMAMMPWDGLSERDEGVCEQAWWRCMRASVMKEYASERDEGVWEPASRTRGRWSEQASKKEGESKEWENQISAGSKSKKPVRAIKPSIRQCIRQCESVLKPIKCCQQVKSEQHCFARKQIGHNQNRELLIRSIKKTLFCFSYKTNSFCYNYKNYVSFKCIPIWLL